MTDDAAAGSRNPPAHRGGRPDAGRRIHDAVPRPIREHGYYTTRDPLGARGDFITAPEVSQMFGELIGLWMAAVWKQMGAPENVRVIELGPGRGTMMKDALRAAKVMPDFREAVVMHLVEISPALRSAAGAHARAAVDCRCTGIRRSTTCREGPAIVVANEFFDALPVHQAVKIRTRLARAPGRDRSPPAISPSSSRRMSIAAFRAPAAAGCAPGAGGSIFEWRADNVAMELGQRLARDGGAALVIDYGHAESAAGDTLQAVGQHAFADPLTAPGQYRSHRACRFPGAGEGGRSHGRQRLRPDHASRVPAPARHRDACGIAQGQGRRAPWPPTSTRRWRA